MNEHETEANPPETRQNEEAKPGLFKRIFTKIDESLKEKADAKTDDNCCGGGKCC